MIGKSKIANMAVTAAMTGLMGGAAASLVGCQQPAPSSTAGTVAPATVAAHDCKGQNACKGLGGCKTANNGCKGQNACKGQGGCKAQ
jgi:hypothetical protein